MALFKLSHYCADSTNCDENLKKYSWIQKNSIKGRPGVFFLSFLFIYFLYHLRISQSYGPASRVGSAPVLLRKTIATCDDFPEVGSGTD